MNWTQADVPHMQQGAGWKVGDVFFGLYRVEAVRSGAMGVVYLCDGGTAIKTILADPLADEHARAQMRAEAEAWLTLGPHPNVVQCTFMIESPYDKRLLLFLERVHGDPQRGTTLTEWMSGGRLDAATVAHLAAGIAHGMQYAWQTAGLIHRDLKPDNVLIAADGTAKVSDFGLARPIAAAGGLGAAGTPAYMAPEAWRGGAHVSIATDVYAFGVILWELLTGAHPFADHFDSQVSLQYAHADVPPDDPRLRNRAAPEPLARLALACLAKRASDRPADFAAVLDALGEVGSFPAVTPVFKLSELNRAQGLMNIGRWRDAEAILERARELEADDQRAVDLLRLRLLDDTGRGHEDRDLLERLAAIAATSGVERRFKQRALRLLGRTAEALAVIDEALAVEEAGDLLHIKGLLLWELQRHDEALAALEAADRFAASLDRARLLFSLRRTEEGFTWLMRALQQNPNDEKALVHVAIELDAQGLTEEALAYADRALHVKPGFQPARAQRASLLVKLGRRPEAMSELRALIAQDPDDVCLWGDLMKALGEHATNDEMRECVEHVLRGRATTIRGHLIKGSVAMMIGRNEQALHAFDAALAIDPLMAIAWDWKGSALLRLNAVEQAADAYRRAVALQPGDEAMRAHLEEAEARMAAERFAVGGTANLTTAEPGRGTADAVPYERQLQDMDPDARAAGWRWNEQATQALRNHNYEEAEKGYRQAIRADPAEPAHAASLATCLMLLADSRPGALDEALTLFADANRRRADDPIILYNYATTLVKAGRAADAVPLVARLRQLTPDDEYLDRLERDVRAALDNRREPRITAYGAGPSPRGSTVRGDGLLVDPSLQMYVALDAIGFSLPPAASGMLVDAMAAFVAKTRGDEEVEWPGDYDVELSHAGNVLGAALRIANDRFLSPRAGPRFDVAAGLVHGDKVEIAVTGDARALLFRDGKLYTMGDRSSSRFNVLDYQMVAGDEIVLAARAAVEPLVRDIFGRTQSPESAAAELADLTGSRVVVLRYA